VREWDAVTHIVAVFGKDQKRLSHIAGDDIFRHAHVVQSSCNCGNCYVGILGKKPLEAASRL